MKNKAITLLTISFLLLGVSACGKKDVTSVVSEVTSVTEKVQETNTSIADKIDNINVDEKTDLSNLPEIEVPDVPEVVEEAGEAEEKEVGEVTAMTEEEFVTIVEAYATECSSDTQWMANATEEEKYEQALRNYVSELSENDDSLKNTTIEEYFGENYVNIPYANKNETLGEYSDAETAYMWYGMDKSMSEILNPSKYEGQKELTPEDFHRDRELTKKWLEPET